MPSPSPSPSPSSGPPSARSTRANKWGRLLGSSSVDSASDTSTKVAVCRSLSARESLRESAQGRQGSTSSSNGGQGNKVSLMRMFYSRGKLQIIFIYCRSFLKLQNYHPVQRH